MFEINSCAQLSFTREATRSCVCFYEDPITAIVFAVYTFCVGCKFLYFIISSCIYEAPAFPRQNRCNCKMVTLWMIIGMFGVVLVCMILFRCTVSYPLENSARYRNSSDSISNHRLKRPQLYSKQDCPIIAANLRLRCRLEMHDSLFNGSYIAQESCLSRLAEAARETIELSGSKLVYLKENVGHINLIVYPVESSTLLNTLRLGTDGIVCIITDMQILPKFTVTASYRAFEGSTYDLVYVANFSTAENEMLYRFSDSTTELIMARYNSNPLIFDKNIPVPAYLKDS
jgi:hypothetical protein